MVFSSLARLCVTTSSICFLAIYLQHSLRRAVSSGGYGDISPESSEDRKVRATEKILSSMSYRLGKLIVDSIRKP